MTFDPAKVSYEKLLDVFWLNHDPTVTNRQFCDSGTQYRPGDLLPLGRAEEARRGFQGEMGEAEALPAAAPHPITKAGAFYPAEDYHQDYYKKNPLQYKFYVTGCGRYARLDSLWGSLRK